MLEVFMMLIGIILCVFGVIWIYDARIITKRYFGFGDQNEATEGLKILGYIFLIIGLLIVYFVK
ncbi:hypothetical protein D3C72_1227750 [compost metagenome]